MDLRSKRGVWIFILVVASLCAACSRSEVPLSESLEERAAAPRSADKQAQESAAQKDAAELASGKRLIIREARLNLRATRPDDVAKRAAALAEAKGGYLLESALSSTDRQSHSLELHLRVPAEVFEVTLKELHGMGDVLTENVTGQDVTDEFVDVTARLNTQRVLEKRLLSLSENTAELSSLLTVEKELARVRTEIEQAEGRRVYLRNSARLSSIYLIVGAPERALEEEAQSVMSRLSMALEQGSRVFVSTLVGLTMFLGFAIPLGAVLAGIFGPVYFLRRRRVRRALGG